MDSTAPTQNHLVAFGAIAVATAVEYSRIRARISTMYLCMTFVALLLVPCLAGASAGATCLNAGLRVDAAMTMATLRVTAKRSPVLDGPDWKRSGASKPGAYFYTLDIRDNILPEGREYPLVIRIAPNMVAVSMRKLTTPTEPGADRICKNIRLSADGALPEFSPGTSEGYAFFRDGLPITTPPVIADDRIPRKLVNRYMDWLHQSRAFYRTSLGPEKRGVASVLFLIDQNESTQQGCRYTGSSLPGLLLIGLRAGCLDGKVTLPGDLPHFIAHEAFHQWNFVIAKTESDPVRNATRLMLLEGGADLAAGIFLSNANATGNHGIEHYVASAAEACVDQAAYQRRSIATLINDGQAQLAYSCGAAYTFLRMTRADHDPVSAFASFWKPLLNVPQTKTPERERYIDTAFSSQIPLQRTLTDLFSRSGYELSVATNGLNKTQRFRIAVELMREISRNDCHGSYGLFTGGYTIVIDPKLKDCRSLRAGAKPVSVDGFDLLTTTLAARSSWLAACRTGGSVQIGYADAVTDPSNVSCKSPPKDLYTPIHLSRHK